MNEPKRNSFFGRPSLGGKLTLVNANFWVIFAILINGESLKEIPRFLDIPLSILLLFMALPFGCFAMLPTLGGPSVQDIIFMAVCLGLNSFVWGYGLAWCIEFIAKFYRKRPQTDLPDVKK